MSKHKRVLQIFPITDIFLLVVIPNRTFISDTIIREFSVHVWSSSRRPLSSIRHRRQLELESSRILTVISKCLSLKITVSRLTGIWSRHITGLADASIHIVFIMLMVQFVYDVNQNIR